MSYQVRRNQTLGDNLRRICQKQVERALEIVRGEREANDTPVHETQKQAAPQLEKLQEEIEVWPVENLDCKNIRCTAQRAYKTARHALGCAKTKPTPENFHEFRSEAKRLLYQLRILRPINPLVIGALIDDLDSVGEVFGRSHDLYFLGERLRRD